MARVIESTSVLRGFQVAFLTAMAGIAGCGDSNAYHPVSGKVVTAGGDPCDGALVVFHPKEEDRVNDPKPFATCEGDGTFNLTTTELGDGAEAGSYGVTIVWNKATKEAKMSLSSESSGGKDVLNGRYGNPSEPQLDAEVVAGSENSFEFVVKK